MTALASLGRDYCAFWRPAPSPQLWPGAFHLLFLDHPRALAKLNQVLGIHTHCRPIGATSNEQIDRLRDQLIVAVTARP
jgi:hypothetical protein